VAHRVVTSEDPIVIWAESFRPPGEVQPQVPGLAEKSPKTSSVDTPKAATDRQKLPEPSPTHAENRDIQEHLAMRLALVGASKKKLPKYLAEDPKAEIESADLVAILSSKPFGLKRSEELLRFCTELAPKAT
jgi:hypothetical protein